MQSTINYLQYEFFTSNTNEQEWLMALLAEIRFEGFEQTDISVLAYVPQDIIEDGEVRLTLNDNNLAHLQFAVNVIEPKNWNEEWERNFPPVIIAEKVGIRAPFHNALHTEIELVIEPKMSFGTGHHATTSLMVEFLLEINLTNRTLLDLGTGTGVLAILAKKLGAVRITAVDHEEWAYKNAIENAEKNQVEIAVIRADASLKFEHQFDVILANINRHIIQENIANWVPLINSKGMIALSGFLLSDVPIMQSLTSALGLKELAQKQKGEWVAMLFQKV